MMMIDYKILRGAQIATAVEDIARLRVEVFAEFPYLYDGTMEDEREYIGHYATSDNSLCIVAAEGEHIVGATTLQPLTEAEEAMREPFDELEHYCYLGEMLIEKGSRGAGIGREMMRQTLDIARHEGYRYMAVCVVDREEDHPLRGANYTHVCTKFEGVGFVCHPEKRAHIEWRQVDTSKIEQNSLTFWIKEL